MSPRRKIEDSQEDKTRGKQQLTKLRASERFNADGVMKAILISPNDPLTNPQTEQNEEMLLHLNPTLHGVLVSGAFQSDLSDPKCWHNSYMIFRISFMEKKFQNFFKIFFNFFQFFGHPQQTKRFFCTFGPKITYFYILGGQHVHLTPPKCFLEV